MPKKMPEARLQGNKGKDFAKRSFEAVLDSLCQRECAENWR
jgi:hypothetical protein